jgi:hypothetical protein
MSHILQLEVSEDVYASLVKAARERGAATETLVTEWLAVVVQELDEDPLEKHIGAFDSHGLDWADNHDRYLGEAIMSQQANETAGEGDE